MLIRIRGMDQGEPCGELVFCSLQKTILFRNLKELIFAIEAISRPKKPAGPEMEFRSLSQGNSGGMLSGKPMVREVYGRQLYTSDVKAIFYLEVIRREHMSLQGRIRGELTAGADVYFRSALELMVMLSELQLSQVP